MGVIAHDMRNPIGATLNAARYLQRLPGLDAAAQNAVGIVLRSSERLSSLTTDVLEFMQVRLHHATDFTPAPTDLRALCEAAIATSAMIHPAGVVTLECSGDTTGGWDAARLERLLSNLVENALKHGAPSSPVTVQLAGEPDAVRLTVRNAGEPIPQARLATMFEPLATWSRDGVPVDEAARSYGLGLFIAREIVREHAGTIGVESAEASGTAFTIVLPRHPRRP